MKNQTPELLKRWASLEPERCTPPEEGELFWLSIPGEGSPELIDTADITLNEWGILRIAVERSILSRKLRSRTESTPEGHHHATLLDLQNGCNAIGDDTEPAIALLQAYVSYLEQVAAKREAVA